MRNRAQRRHYRQRAEARARKIIRGWRVPPSFVEDKVVRLADNLQCCSCWMCQNPRRVWGHRTLQEHRWCYEIDDELST